MNEPYGFKSIEITKIKKRFGDDFYDKVVRDIEAAAKRWELTDVQLIPSYSANLVFTCTSAPFGDVVLKIGNPSSFELVTEYHTLSQYHGERFCKVFDVDMERRILLEACVRPGNPLREESFLDARLAVFCSVYKDLHRAPIQADLYPTYIGWVSRITDYMSQRPNCTELTSHMQRAKDICLSVVAVYSQRMLLHGDLHHDNLLLGPTGEYTIIDPKGVVGDPVFDVPRFILNEFGDDITPDLFQKITYIINILAQNLSIPSAILKQCLYVETVMGACWSVEDGASSEDYKALVQQAVFAERVVNS